MANKETVALTVEQYEEIIKTMRVGGAGFRPNDRIATILVLEANLGMRISDVLAMKQTSIVKDGERYRLNITEIKTRKRRTFTVSKDIVGFIEKYCKENNIEQDDYIFSTTERNVQIYLAKVCDYLGYENIGTHSFRNFFATDILIKNNYNFLLVQKLLQHASVTTTQRYIGITSKEMEEALNNHAHLL